LERIGHDVPAGALDLHLAAALHLRHRAHRGHLVLEAELGAVDGRSARVLERDVEPVVAGPRRIGIDGELDVGVAAPGRLGLRLRARAADEERDEQVTHQCLSGWPDSAARASPRSAPTARSRSASRCSYMTRWLARSSSCICTSRSLSRTMRKLER